MFIEARKAYLRMVDAEKVFDETYQQFELTGNSSGVSRAAVKRALSKMAYQQTLQRLTDQYTIDMSRGEGHVQN